LRDVADIRKANHRPWIAFELPYAEMTGIEKSKFNHYSLIK
jgi:hypothetical protein